MGIESSANFRRLSHTVTTSGSVAGSDLAQLGAEGYDLVIDLLPADSPYAVADEGAILRSQGVGYVQIPVDFAAPARTDLQAFTTVMDENVGKTIHVHCAANYRVSAFYGLYALGKGWWSAEEADAHIRDIWNPAEYPPWDRFVAEERARLTPRLPR
jgi:protein tyrosine phosphatase (PTP) superfamily phosphohydrolase (DUF442 family)